MFSYYGSKSKVVSYYPVPKYGKIIEPFAGSARYALKYWDREVLLVDKYDVVVDIWNYLKQCSREDILGLPKLTVGTVISDLNISDIERKFLGMIAGIASVSPRNKVSPFAVIQNGRKNKMIAIADNLFKIKHWEIKLGNYTMIENEAATWFIDPPYQFGGGYKFGDMDFPKLKEWILSRQGQVIACENTKATWMNFKPMKELAGAMGRTTEAIWSNVETQYDFTQQILFNSTLL